MFPPQTKDEDWTSLEEVSKEFQSGGKPHSGVLPIFEILKDYAKADSAGFNKKLAAVMERVNSLKPEETRKARFETFFNHFEPFYKCALVYGFVFVVVCVSWVSWREVLSPTAFWLTVATLLLHTWAIGVRMYLQERPPITNLYSTAVFVGWGAVIAFLAIELIYKNGLGNALGAIAGLLSMILAHNLAGDSDTMPMLQAVLDTNFWLATHVTVVNLGYAATMVAGFIGIVFVVLGIGTRIMTPEVQRTVGQALYGVICFAMFFSFLGTVLGGIWADQSWGRFWGWDPKENGAVLVVIWNALILHARWGGIAKMRGISLLAIFGNIVTAWSWFGTNQLGVGLHSYGFMKGAVTWLIIWAALNLVLIGIGSIPRRYWRSYASTTAAVKPPKAKPPVSRRKSELVSAR